MALGGTVGIFGQLAQWGKKLLPWGAAGVGAEVLTNDGDGGIIADAWRGTSQAAAVEASATQAIDQQFDMISGAQNGISTFIAGALAGIVEAIAYFTKSEQLAEVAANMRGLEQHTQQIINSRVEAARKSGSQSLDEASADPDAPAPEGTTPFAGTPAAGVMDSIENVIPDNLDGGNATVATAEAAIGTTAAVLAGKALLTPKAAATATTQAAQTASKFGWFGKIVAATILAGGGAIALDAATAEETGAPATPTADETGAVLDPANPPEGTVVRMGIDANGEPIAIVEEKVDLLANPVGFVEDIGQDLSSMVQPRADGNGVEVNWSNTGEVSADFGKSVWYGLNTTSGWLVGGVADLANMGDNFFGINVIADPDKPFSEQSAQYMSDSFNRMSNTYLGGAPDMNSGLNQVGAFGGGMLAGTPLTKALSLSFKAAAVGTDVVVSNAAVNTVTLGQNTLGPALVRTFD